ncbi:MAG TPA: c-type cytochrome domain-containing protein [Chitinophagaceae bacterium]|nr:c-type cytochrome domain-containing protein [Chitinophagaceae bacterium]
MKLIRRGSLYLIVCLNILLVFLSFFSDKLELPEWLLQTGRLHPLILHFPLALLLVSVAIFLTRKWTGIHQTEIFDLLFLLASFTAVASALFGLFLSTEGGYDKEVLGKHQWLGVSVSLLSLMVVLLYQSGNVSRLLLNGSMLVTVPVLIIGSHFGGVLTHGADFLQREDLAEAKQVVVTDSSVIFAALVEPILSSKCYSCHNDKKAKGELIMTSVEKLLKGGKDGKLWVPGDPLNSHILQRLDLPEDDKKHMPPRGKTQITEKEKRLITEWIRMGAPMDKRILDYPPADSFRIFLAAYIPKTGSVKTYSFEPADPSLIDKIKSPYCNIVPVAFGSPALQVRFLIRSGFDPKMLKDLEKLSKQVVDINLTNMPVKDEDLQTLKNFSNLEILNLNGTDVKGSGFVHILPLPILHTLSVSNTKLDESGIDLLAKSAHLKNIYCWNTIVDSARVQKLKSSNASINWNIGFIPDPNELLQLTPPQLVNEEKFILNPNDTIFFKHPMPGVQIKYTTDGSKPDSLNSPAYNKGILINRATRVRTIAIRPGWLTSDTTDHAYFIKSLRPAYTRLLTPPDSSYTAKRDTTLFDNVKGEMNAIQLNWIGVTKNDLILFAYFKEPVKVNEVIVSALKKTGPYIMPPEKIELWAGNDSTKMKLISTVVPIQPGKYEADKIEIHSLPVNNSYQYFRIRVNNVKKLPKWHEGKGKKAWAFVDEIFFN